MSSACVTTSGAISSATRFITLISGLSAGPAVSLNGSPTVSPITAALWALAALPAEVALLDELLRVVPGAARVRQHHREQLTGEDRAGQERAERLGPSAGSPAMTGASTASSPGVISSRSEVFVQMSTTAAVVRLLGVVHDPRVVAELVPHLDHDLRRGPPDRADRERREQERDRAAEQQPDQHVRVVDPDRRRRSKPAPRSASSNEPNSDVAAMTAVAIARPFVMAFVEFPIASRPPRISAGRPSNSPGHLRDALRVVRDRAERVHGHDDARPWSASPCRSAR